MTQRIPVTMLNRVEDAAAQRNNEGLQAPLGALLRKFAPMLKAQMIELTVPTGGVEQVQIIHGLGQQPTGWIVTDRRTAFWQQYRMAWDARSVTVAAEAGTDVSIVIW